MMKWLHLPLLLVISLALSACGESTHSDLDQFIRDAGNNLQGKVTPPLEVKPYKYYPYDAFDIPDPFKPRKSEAMKKGGGGFQPDLKRRREFLESFPLESLKMVGSLQQSKVIYALVKAPDGTLHRVKAGGYLGQDFGLVTGISESELKLKEIVQDNTGDWVERISTLMLENQEQNK